MESSAVVRVAEAGGAEAARRLLERVGAAARGAAKADVTPDITSSGRVD
jgi:hypothetical protein